MRILLFSLFIWAGNQVLAQSLYRATFSSGGTNSPQLTATIGEPVAVSNAGSLFVGAQPGADDKVNHTSTAVELDGIKILPNPTDGVLGVVVDAVNLTPLQAVVYAINGDFLLEQSLDRGYNTLDMCALPASCYLLFISSPAGSASFQIIKQ